VVLPSHNEAENIGPLLEQIVSMSSTIPHPVRIIVVDDGSTDETAARVTAMPFQDRVRLVSHPRNQGLARALNTGLRAALAEPASADVVITLDADNTHDPKYMPAMIRKILDGCDVVIASRFAPSGEEVGVPPLRRFLSHGASWVFRATLRMRGVRDYTCGYRAYRREILELSLIHNSEPTRN